MKDGFRVSGASRRGARAAAAVAVALLVGSAPACDRRPRSLPLAVGQTVEGRLEPGDWTDVFADGSFTDLYELDLAAGQTVTIELGSTEMDTYLSLMRAPGDQVVDNDDVSPDDTDSRVVYTSASARRYFVAATSFQSGATGAYRLSVRRGGEAGDRPDPGPAAPRDKASE